MNNKKPKTDLDRLKYLYLNTNLNIKEICKELDITFHTAKKWIKRLNLHRTPEQLERISKITYQNREKNLLKKYGVTNVAKLDFVKQKISKFQLERWKSLDDTYKEEIVRKLKQTKLDRYDDENYNNVDKCKQTKLDRYGDENYNNQIQNNLTRSKNRTSGKSKEERQLEVDLINHYGKDSIQVQFKISEISRLKYDFKINDLLLELNGQFWHNYRPFQNDEKDNQEYYSLKEKGGMYKAIAKHWKYDDVKKLNYCIENNINYIVLYFDNLPDNMLEIIHKYRKGQTILTYRDNKLVVQRLSKADN